MKNIMKNELIANIIAVAVFLTPTLTLATTASFSPVNISASAEEKFDIVVLVNPQGVANYVEKIEVDYPSDILSVSSFNFAEKWLPINQKDYDLIDNLSGVLVKTAGYPGGITGLTIFGSISFTSKKAGSGIIKIGNGSVAFESKSQSSVTGDAVSFVVNSATPAVLEPKTEIEIIIPNLPKQTTSSDELNQPSSVRVLPELQTAAAAGATRAGGSAWLQIIGGIAAVIILTFGIYLAFRGRKSV